MDAGDAGVTFSWASPEADVVLLLDGDQPSVEQKSGQKWIAADRTKLVRIAAIRENSTSWSVTKVDGRVIARDGASGVVLLGDGTPFSERLVSIDGPERTSDAAGRFPVPDGTEPYSIAYSFTYGAHQDLTTHVLLDGVTIASPVVRTKAGDTARNISLVVRVTNDIVTTGRGYLTSVIARVGADGNVRDIPSPGGQAVFPSFYWHGAPTAKLTVTAVRQYVKAIVTEDTYDRPDILGASEALEVEVHDGDAVEVDVHVAPVEADVRDFFLPSEFNNTAALMSYGAPGVGPSLYSGRAGAQSKLHLVRGTGYWAQWTVSEPAPADGDFENGARGSGDFLVPGEGAIVAPLYRAARLTTPELLLQDPVLAWDMPQPCLCRAMVSRASSFQNWTAYAVGSVDLLKLGVEFAGTYNLTLDCFPEIASVDDILSGQRGIDVARGVGRLARVQTVTSFVVRD